MREHDSSKPANMDTKCVSAPPIKNEKKTKQIDVNHTREGISHQPVEQVGSEQGEERRRKVQVSRAC
jgi:hypothetical protein